MMGLPIRNLVVATNENDVLDEFFKTGIYAPRGSEQTFHTSSPSMDISKASNFERFIFDLLNRDSESLKNLWNKIDKGGSFELDENSIKRIEKFGFVSSSSKHMNRIHLISEYYKKFNVIMDTHTADGIKAALDHFDPSVPMMVLETALPIKFEESIEEAIGKKPDRPDSLKNIEKLEQRFKVFDNNVDQVKSFIELNK